MARRSKQDDWADEADVPVAIVHCWLCQRPMGSITEWHHPVPKSRGGKIKEPVHPICHETIHANLTNSDLAKRYATPDALREHEAIGRFVEWVAGKPADFSAPTKKR
jgi:hypothetical protein